MLKKNLALAMDFTKGALLDLSGNENDGAMTFGEVFTSLNGSLAINGQNGLINIPNDSTLDTNAITLCFGGDLTDGLKKEQCFIDKRSAGSADFVVYTPSDNNLTFLGTVASNINIPDSDLKGATSLIITKASGSSIPKVYLNGIFYGNMSAATEIGNNGNNIYIGRIYFNVYPLKTKLTSIAIYNDEKGVYDLGIIKKWQNSVKTPYSSVRNNLYPINVQKDNDPDLVSAWTMEIINSNIVDNISGGLDLMKAGIVENRIGISRNKLLYFGGGYATGMMYASEDWSSGFSFGAYVCPDSVVGIQYLIDHRDSFASDQGFAVRLNSGVLEFWGMDAGVGAWKSCSNTIAAGQEIHVGVEYDNVNVGFYLNGTLINQEAYTEPVGVSSAFVYLSADTSGANTYLGTMDEPKIMKRAIGASKMMEWASTKKGRVLYNQDFSDSYVQLNNTNAIGSPIPSTDLNIIAAGLKVVNSSERGRKAIIGSTFGSRVSTVHDGRPYGTYEWDVERASGQRLYFSAMNNDDSLLTGQFMSVDCGGGGNDYVQVNTETGVNLTTSVGSLPVGNYKFRLVIEDPAVKPTNNCSLFVDGSLIAADTGSNPWTYAPSLGSINYMLAAPYSGGKILKITKKY